MRLVEFLIKLLEAQAQTLQRLAALFGEKELLKILEASGEQSPGEEIGIPAEASEFEPPRNQGFSSPYAELESAIQGFKLPSVLEFHLWAYPPYRAYIESELDLDSVIPGPGGDLGLKLVDDAVSQAEGWVRKLLIPPGFAAQAEQAAHMPWLRFRTQVLKRVGKRPMGPVY